jgi:hypothetical protein
LVGGGKCTAAAVAAAGVLAWRMAYIGFCFGLCVLFLPSAFSAKKAFLCFSVFVLVVVASQMWY